MLHRNEHRNEEDPTDNSNAEPGTFTQRLHNLDGDTMIQDNGDVIPSAPSLSNISDSPPKYESLFPMNNLSGLDDHGLPTYEESRLLVSSNENRISGTPC